MKSRAFVALFLLVVLTNSVVDLANASPGPLSASSNAADSKEMGAIQIGDKAMRKISMAIGEEVGDFAVTAQEQVESGVGSNATQYTVRTSGGRSYKCQIIEPSRAEKIFSFGTAAGADALCTQFGGTGDGDRRTTNEASGMAGGSGENPESAAAIAISDKAARKISMAIGEDTDRFVVTQHEDVEAAAGMQGTEYTVRTDGGRTFKCQILEPSKLGRIVTFGTAGGSDALCTDFTKGSKDQGKTNQASCNALLRAAHRCN